MDKQGCKLEECGGNNPYIRRVEQWFLYKDLKKLSGKIETCTEKLSHISAGCTDSIWAQAWIRTEILSADAAFTKWTCHFVLYLGDSSRSAARSSCLLSVTHHLLQCSPNTELHRVKAKLHDLFILSSLSCTLTLCFLLCTDPTGTRAKTVQTSTNWFIYLSVNLQIIINRSKRNMGPLVISTDTWRKCDVDYVLWQKSATLQR